MSCAQGTVFVCVCFFDCFSIVGHLLERYFWEVCLCLCVVDIYVLCC